tara:strand:+ start:1442 stop:1873 length:432 start_codon:yes stop_codon:yes gene_type:complete
LTLGDFVCVKNDDGTDWLAKILQLDYAENELLIEWWYFSYVKDNTGHPASQQGYIGVTDEAWKKAGVQHDDLILDNDYPPMTIELCMVQDKADVAYFSQRLLYTRSASSRQYGELVNIPKKYLDSEAATHEDEPDDGSDIVIG